MNQKNKAPKKLEDYEPGATKEEVHRALKLVALNKNQNKKKPQKPISQSEQA
jgi:hypothetical protein